MTKNLQNLFWENELNSHLDKEQQLLKLKNRSEVLRLIIKRYFGICEQDGCFAPIVPNKFCSNHLREHFAKKTNGDKK